MKLAHVLALISACASGRLQLDAYLFFN